ncbi:MAG: AI-2E family transporter [Nanoarchaeota archaeon]
MNFGEKDSKKLLLIISILALAVLVFILLKPLIVAIISGLILAYVCLPFYKKINTYAKNKTLAAFIVIFIICLAIVIPLWFLVPIMVQQVFEIFTFSQNLDVQGIINDIFPTGSEQFAVQVTIAINSLISKASSGILNYLVNFLLEVPVILLNIFVIGFIFFFAVRDSEKLMEFIKSLSPLSESKEKILIKNFKDITNSIIYGQVIVGIVQGSLAGLGLIIFGIDKALFLTILAIFLSIIPFIGPSFVWIPVSIYLFASGNIWISVGFLFYNLFIVSIIDNILRTYIVSKKTEISSAIILVGMIGGVMIFGIIGLILGPLILSYFLTFLKYYKDKNLYTLFSG